MSTNSNFRITSQQAETILFDCYSITGLASNVHGEIDLNFRVDVDDLPVYLLKISRPNVNIKHLDFQNQLLLHLSTKTDQNCNPEIFRNKNQELISEFIDDAGATRYVRLLSWIPGRLWHQVNPQNDQLRYALGKQAGLVAGHLSDFNHPHSERSLEWDVAQSLWTMDYVDLFLDEEKELVNHFQKRFELLQSTYSKLRKSVVHNDVNDHNVVVSMDLKNPDVVALFDYGDAIYTQIINDVAIACAYAIKEFPDPLTAALPLIKGYHEAFPLKENELEHLYLAIAMRLIISVCKAEINRVAEPDNEYLQISKKSAMSLLKQWRGVNEEFATYSFRQVCGFSAHPDEALFREWANASEFSLADLFPSVTKNSVIPLDLSVGSRWLGHASEFSDLNLFEFKINKLQLQHPDSIIAGGYLEARALYITSDYDAIGNHGRQSRTVHLGIDYWLAADTPVHAMQDGVVVAATDNAGDKQYGGLVILKHLVQLDTDRSFSFYSLYGHLNVASATQHKLGDVVKKGQCFAKLGCYPENGNWAPHLHFQLMLSMLGYENDFAGVAYHSQTVVWRSLCPDPNLLFKSEALNGKKVNKNKDLIAYRKRHLGKSMSLQYETPIKIVRGSGQYLIDQYGKKYLDTVNNVAHIGHEHPDVVRAGQQQMALLNTNTRYLHDSINQFTRELLSTFPETLNVVHFVNSGSEANELAMRMAKAATGQQDFIASEIGYHGNTNATVDVSSYKFDGAGGQGSPEYTHIFPLPDSFRGRYRGVNTGPKYAYEVQTCIDSIKARGRGLAGLIVEPIVSCGGQVVLPEDFLTQAYAYIREAGGVCISDEVQVGCGRVGKVFWGFQLHNVVPDIVTIGKPLGNGHPVAAVVCTTEIADKFAIGMEYFNTFGGNPVSCAIGYEVLQVIKREKLQQNASIVGEFLKKELNSLSIKHPILGDIRGEGLFLGIELVDENLNPLEAQASYLVNRMKDFSILMSTDGQDHNVLKIKPPLVFGLDDAKEVLYFMDIVLREDFMQLENLHLN